jgi:hypothetical protein
MTGSQDLQTLGTPTVTKMANKEQKKIPRLKIAKTKKLNICSSNPRVLGDTVSAYMNAVNVFY